jgi:hypothetical protein
MEARTLIDAKNAAGDRANGAPHNGADRACRGIVVIDSLIDAVRGSANHALGVSADWRQKSDRQRATGQNIAFHV